MPSIAGQTESGNGSESRTLLVNGGDANFSPSGGGGPCGAWPGHRGAGAAIVDLVVFTGTLNKGGAETQLSRVLPGLVQRGHSVAVCTLFDGGPLAATLQAGGVEVHVPEAPFRLGGGLIRHWRRHAVLHPRLRKVIRRHKPGLIQFVLPHAYIEAAPVALDMGQARLIMSRRSLNDYQADSPRVARIERELHPKMDAFIANAPPIAAQLRAEGAPAERIHYIPNGIEVPDYCRPDRREAMRAMLGLSPDTLTLIIVANLISYKGHRDLIAALSEIATQMPKDWCLLVAGRDDGLGDDLRRQAGAAGILERIRFLGARDDIADLLAASDIAVLASHEEGMPNAVMEAMAAGLPIVATQVGGVAELLAGGDCGLMAAPRAPESLGAALLQVTGDAGLRSRLAQAARQRVSAEYSLQACIVRHEALYLALSGS